MPKRYEVGFTGTQDGMTDRQIAGFKMLLDIIDVLHHGKCMGADYQAWKICHDEEMMTHGHPCTITYKQRQTKDDWTEPVLPPLERNQQIVNTVELLIAAPKTAHEEQRSGTWFTIRRARERGIPIIILEP